MNIKQLLRKIVLKIRGEIGAVDADLQSAKRDISGLQSGLSNVDNTSDMDKPISTAQQQGLNKPLYNLGAFDRISGNVITRQTGYANLEDLDWYYRTESNGYNSPSLSTLIKKAAYDGSLTEIIILCSNVKTTFADDVFLGNIGIAVGVEGTIYYKDTNTNETTKPKGIIQYKLATSYTEEIIEGQPLITLDSQGSQWLRDEWEKRLNLLDYNSRIVNKAINSSGQIIDYSGAYYIKVSLKPNTTYNASSCISSDGGSINLFTSNGTFIRRIINSNLDSKGNFITDSNVSYALCDNLADRTQPMLVEGDHAYPYQEYNSKAHITNYEADFLKEESLKSANLWDEQWESGSLGNNGEKVDNVTMIRGVNFISVEPNTTYTINTNSVIWGYDSGKGSIGELPFTNGYTFTTPSNCYYLRFRLSSDYGTTYKNDVMINKGSTAFPYQKYNGSIVREKQLNELENKINEINNSILGALEGEY